jgi:hypothetical protein
MILTGTAVSVKQKIGDRDSFFVDALSSHALVRMDVRDRPGLKPRAKKQRRINPAEIVMQTAV